MGKPKYRCETCNASHERPIGTACKYAHKGQNLNVENGSRTHDGQSSDPATGQTEILSALTALGSKLDSMEICLASTEKQLKENGKTSGREPASVKEKKQSSLPRPLMKIQQMRS